MSPSCHQSCDKTVVQLAYVSRDSFKWTSLIFKPVAEGELKAESSPV